MVKIKAFVFLIAFIFFEMAYSQDTIQKKWKFAFQFDNRFSSINANSITIFGAKTGVQYKNLTRFGVGASFILNPVSFEYFNKKRNENEVNTINFWYVSVFNDWILYKKYNWECFLTEQLGYGKPSFLKEVNDNIVSDVNIGLVVNEVSGQATYKINSWIGLGAGAGYRTILNPSARLKTTFNAPIYILKIIIYPDAIFN
jgi:hypothetical protein